MLGRRHRQIFFHGDCQNANSYYFDEHGDVPLRPSLTLEAAWRSARFDLEDYRFQTATHAAVRQSTSLAAAASATGEYS